MWENFLHSFAHLNQVYESSSMKVPSRTPVNFPPTFCFLFPCHALKLMWEPHHCGSWWCSHGFRGSMLRPRGVRVPWPLRARTTGQCAGLEGGTAGGLEAIRAWQGSWGSQPFKTLDPGSKVWGERGSCFFRRKKGSCVSVAHKGRSYAASRAGPPKPPPSCSLVMHLFSRSPFARTTWLSLQQKAHKVWLFNKHICLGFGICATDDLMSVCWVSVFHIHDAHIRRGRRQ